MNTEDYVMGDSHVKRKYETWTVPQLSNPAVKHGGPWKNCCKAGTHTVLARSVVSTLPPGMLIKHFKNICNIIYPKALEIHFHQSELAPILCCCQALDELAFR